MMQSQVIVTLGSRAADYRSLRLLLVSSHSNASHQPLPQAIIIIKRVHGILAVATHFARCVSMPEVLLRILINKAHEVVTIQTLGDWSLGASCKHFDAAPTY